MARDLPKDGRRYRIWSVVEELIVERYDALRDERMRDSYYRVREWLNQRREAGEITDPEFDYFVEMEQYEYYRDSIWPRIEKKHGLARPATKPPTIVIEDGREYGESYMHDAWDRSRGFIFVEKSGMAEDLSLLSEHGWLIVAAQGESTRSFRERVADDGTDRPVLVVTDADFYGDGIAQTLMGHSQRTEHLELWRELESRVREIGLSPADADALDLPKERDPTQSPDKWRTELNALSVLKDRAGLANPLLSYIVAKMDQEGIPLCPLPDDEPLGTVRGGLRSAIQEAMSEAVEDAISAVTDGLDPASDMETRGDGPLMQLRYRHGGQDAIDMGDLQDELEEVAKTRLKRQYWQRQSAYEERVKNEAGSEDVDSVAAMLS